MLADERLRVQVFELDVGAELAAEVAGGVSGHVAQVAHHAEAVGDHVGQLVAEDEQGEQQEGADLPPVEVFEHARDPSQAPAPKARTPAK
ncbi:hypothetical protein Psuf_027210 [Phytohabitans suffuscus]|uniref:Uncharacterized protein n=1 Tax=Phytohabitans suffuscus TaxID=624315 RepID=A0A6F8YHG6_9ACTN|nr:hypothetical protein Psuf_027210 [Phytohabitans suffuscus]